MSIRVYQYPNCSSCKRALNFLTKNNIYHESFNIVENTPSKSELKSMLESYGGDVRKLFNTSGKMYRELKLSQKLAEMSEAESIKLLSENAMLIKRPFLISKKLRIVGFKEDSWSILK